MAIPSVHPNNNSIIKSSMKWFTQTTIVLLKLA